MTRCGKILILALLFNTAVHHAFAGPPFFTDDPQPVDYQHWEINTAFMGTHASGESTGAAPSVDINYGAAPNVQVHITPSLAYDRSRTMGTHLGYGDTELGVKYRFLEAAKDDWWPQIAVYPLLELPTGSVAKGLSTTGKPREYFPVWMQKDFGDWRTYGGGGYWNNQGRDNRNYWYYGWVLERKMTDQLTLGSELYHQTANTIAGDPAAVASFGFTLGGNYDFNENYHLLFSAGQAVQHVSATNGFSYYLGLQWTF